MALISTKILTTFAFLCQSSVAYAKTHRKCQDSPGSLVVYGDHDEDIISVDVKSCVDVKADTTLCTNNVMEQFCPVTCGTCDPAAISPGSSCEIDLDLRFSNKSGPDVSRYYKSDTMIIKKQGFPGSSQDVCSSFNSETSWGCTHEGEALVEFNQQIVGNHAPVRIDEENVRITDAAGSNFRVQVRHNFDDKEVDQPTPSWRRDVRSRLVVVVNGEMRKRRRFRQRKNNGIPTHIVPNVWTMDKDAKVEESETKVSSGNNMPEHPREFNPVDIPVPGGEGGQEYDPDESGYINPDYAGTFFVDIYCDDNCKCRMRRRIPKCEVTALLLPDSKNFNRTEHLTVRKEGETNVPPCSKENPQSYWCGHYGEASAKEVFTSDYIKVFRQAEAVKIPIAVSSTYVFSVSRDLPPPVDDTPFGLMIHTPYKTYGPFSGTEAGATVYSHSWGLSCDHDCNCDRPYPMPSL